MNRAMPYLSEIRSKAKFYCVNNGVAVLCKEGVFFRSQGGLDEGWGRLWVGIEAGSIGEARRFAAEIFNVQLSYIYSDEK